MSIFLRIKILQATGLTVTYLCVGYTLCTISIFNNNNNNNIHTTYIINDFSLFLSKFDGTARR